MIKSKPFHLEKNFVLVSIFVSIFHLFTGSPQSLRSRIDPDNPMHIPTAGNFYHHDDRRSGFGRGRARGGRADLADGARPAPTRPAAKLWEPEEPKWTHDKFEELLKEDEVRQNVEERSISIIQAKSCNCCFVYFFFNCQQPRERAPPQKPQQPRQRQQSQQRQQRQQPERHRRPKSNNPSAFNQSFQSSGYFSFVLTCF